MRLSISPIEIAPGIQTTGEIPLKTDFESPEPNFFVEKDGARSADLFIDENALILESDSGLVVLQGCAHRGIINTLEHVSQLKDGAKVHAVLGGLHLSAANANKVEHIAQTMSHFGIEKLVIGHCTGFEAMSILHHHFGTRMTPNLVGLRLEF
jgi:7,8-dihydropterin-6-yl-methyl-4-(beta-D-ribofuranosyl)aminobenzene 5'-phosphate synthase